MTFLPAFLSVPPPSAGRAGLSPPARRRGEEEAVRAGEEGRAAARRPRQEHRGSGSFADSVPAQRDGGLGQSPCSGGEAAPGALRPQLPACAAPRSGASRQRGCSLRRRRLEGTNSVRCSAPVLVRRVLAAADGGCRNARGTRMRKRRQGARSRRDGKAPWTLTRCIWLQTAGAKARGGVSYQQRRSSSCKIHLAWCWAVTESCSLLPR